MGSNTQSNQTPNNLVSATLVTIIPGNSFWTVAGGAQPIDAGGAVPTFNGDIVLRGGVSSMCLTNRVNPTDTMPSDPVRVVIFTVWAKSNPAVLAFPLTVPLSWDPSVVPDFDRYGRVLSRKEAILKGDGECLEVFFRHKIQKIDQAVFNSNGSRLHWFILLSQTSNTEAVPTAETVDIVHSISYSFTADAT